MQSEDAGAPEHTEELLLASLEQRPDLLDDFIALDAHWPPFMLNDPHALLLGRVGLHVASHSFLVLDGDDVIGRAVSVPVHWGLEDELPQRGWDAAVESAVEVLLNHTEPRSLCALEITLRPGTRGGGTGSRVLELLRQRAEHLGLEELLAPVRPTGKASQPRMSMQEYLSEVTSGGRSDPWLETHRLLGAEVHGVAELSMTISATFDSWLAWTGEDPELVDGPQMWVRGALAPVMLDHTNRTGTYVEPNVWCRHRITSALPVAGHDSSGKQVVDLRDPDDPRSLSTDGDVLDLRDFDSVVAPPEIADGWIVTRATGPLVAEAERLEHETFVRSGFCEASSSSRVETYDPWRETSEFVVVISPRDGVQGAVRFMVGRYEDLPVGSFERFEPDPPDPVLEYASLSVAPECRKRGVAEWLYRAVWQETTLRGAAGMVAIGEDWLMSLLNDSYGFGFRQLGPARWYMGGSCFAMGTDVGSLMKRMLRQPSLFRWGSDALDLRDIPRPEVRSAVEELRRL